MVPAIARTFLVTAVFRRAIRVTIVSVRSMAMARFHHDWRFAAVADEFATSAKKLHRAYRQGDQRNHHFRNRGMLAHCQVDCPNPQFVQLKSPLAVGSDGT